MKRALLLLVDGLRPDLLERELALGHLPHLAKLAAAGGAGRAITAFPSTTSVSYLPFLTGSLPGRCNVPSIRWMDRRAYGGSWWRDREAIRSYCGYQAGRLDGDIDPAIKTIFELVPESAAFFTMITKGLTPARDPAQSARRFWGALSHYLLWHQPGDDAVTRHLLAWLERDAGWRFLFGQFPAVDGYTHQSDPASPAVIRALGNVDRSIGHVVELLNRQGRLEQTLILVVSDHGASTVQEHFDLAVWFRRQGVPTLAHPELWRGGARVATMVAGNGSAMLYAEPNVLRGERWGLDRLRHPSTFGVDADLIDRLVHQPAVAMIVGEDSPGRLRILSADGEAAITVDGGSIAYRPLTADPLELGPFDGDRRDWLRRTFASAYPDAPVQLLDQFRSARTGDAIVIAREGYDLRDRWEIPEHKAGHGSLIRAHMLTPLLANRPLPDEPLRTADLFATILDWIGEPIPAGIDGELIWSAEDRQVSARTIASGAASA